MNKQQAIDLCFHWHSGGSSPMYQFASNGGVLENKLHQSRLLKEIYEDISWNFTQEGNKDAVNDPEKDIPELEALAVFVRTLPLEHEDN